MITRTRYLWIGVGIFLLFAPLTFSTERGAAADDTKTIQKSESFDKDPGWEGFNNRIVPKKIRMVTQDFGYSLTNFAGKEKGEIGGKITRSSKPAYYAAKITPQTLDNKLSASGSFAITATQSGAGLFFGFFNGQQPGGSGRPIASLGMDFDFESKGARLAVRLITAKNQSCGTFITPYLPGKFRPTPLKKDGTRYFWKLDYDPLAAGGKGRFTFTLGSETHKTQDYGALPERSEREARMRFPNTTVFTVDLTDGFKQQGTVFDRFGMINMMKSGGTATMFFDDLQYNGQTEDFSKDPDWTGMGNRASYEDHEQAGAHNFGYSPETSFAGGNAGEVGGDLWRSGKYAYYADRVGSLSLDDRLEAHGKVMLRAAGPDSDIYLGWFSAAEKENPPATSGHFVGVHIGGPTRVGHYFQPAFATAKGTRGAATGAPVLPPGKVYDWSLVYDPAAEGGKGTIRATLGPDSVTLTLKKGQKAEGAHLDRFGLFNSTAGGQVVRIYLDDVQYTAARKSP